MKRAISWVIAPLVTTITGMAILAACGSGGAPGASDAETEEPTPSPSVDAARPRDAATPPVFEGGIQEDTGVGPPPDGGNDLSGCLDPDDPGGTEPTAKLLPNTDDCDSNRRKFSGVIRGLADSDMYRVSVSDKFGCSLDSMLKFEGTGLEFCAFFKCTVNGSTTDVKSCGGGVKTDSAIGLHGCCGGSPTTLVVDWNCTGTTDEASDVYFRVRPTQNVCAPYSLEYNF